MAFHQINIESKSFELAPRYIQNPATASAESSGEYGFLLFRHDVVNPSISQLYCAGPWDLPLIKYSGGHISTGCNILPDANNDWSVGSSNLKFKTMYATTFHGALSGNATSATAPLMIPFTSIDFASMVLS